MTQRRSTIVASQLLLEDWHSAIADPTVTNAVLDRLVHNDHKVIMRGDSMRTVLADSTVNES